ncbi:MAG: molecular chaperone GrpE [Acidobacteriota bacterium]|jgi:molecular chaperone GrpE (heat shock protein)|nr:molecular chaperone GrpE [Acidobacteriota bacterium]
MEDLAQLPVPVADPAEQLAAEAPIPPVVSQDAPAPDVDVSIALTKLQETVKGGFADLLEQLRDKLIYDRFKEEQIARLHEELQSYKSDLISKPARQLLQGLIRLHDDLGKMAAALRQKPVEELTPERFFQQFAGFQDDLELLLGQNGVEPFQISGDVFDPRRQTTIRMVPADDPARVGQIAERLRPGFEQGEALLQKERVAVYVASNGNHKVQGGQS